MPHSIRVFIRSAAGGYTAECLEVEATASGETIDETVSRVRAEVTRCLDGVDLASLGLEPDPPLFITLEDVPLSNLKSGCLCRHGMPVTEAHD